MPVRAAQTLPTVRPVSCSRTHVRQGHRRATSSALSSVTIDLVFLLLVYVSTVAVRRRCTRGRVRDLKAAKSEASAPISACPENSAYCEMGRCSARPSSGNGCNTSVTVYWHLSEALPLGVKRLRRGEAGWAELMETRRSAIASPPEPPLQVPIEALQYTTAEKAREL